MANENNTPPMPTSEEGMTDWIADHIIGDQFKEFNPDSGTENLPEDEKAEVEESEVVLEEEPKEETPEDESKEPEEEKEKPDPIQKRIDKLTAQKKTAEEALAAAQKSLEEYEKSPKKEIVLAPSPKDPLSDMLSKEDLDSKAEAIERMREHCIRNPDGFHYKNPDTGEDVFVDAEAVRGHLVDTDRMLRKDIPARQKWIETNATVDAQARKTFPALFDKRTAEYQTAQSMLQQLPELKRIPSYNYIIGCAIAGEKLMLAQSKPPVTSKNDTKKVPTPPTASAGAVANANKKTPTKPTARSSQGDIENIIAERFLSNMKF